MGAFVELKFADCNICVFINEISYFTLMPETAVCMYVCVSSVSSVFFKLQYCLVVCFNYIILQRLIGRHDRMLCIVFCFISFNF